MAGKQRTNASSLPENTKRYQLDVLKAIDNIGWYLERNRFYLPVSLPSSSSLPADVALWLIELRHKSDSSDLVTPVHAEEEEEEDKDDEPGCCSDVEDSVDPEDPGPEERGADDNGFQEISMNVHDDEDTVLNLDLHRKKGSHQNKIYDENDLFQIWEGLRIPRQSLCSSLRVPNVNSNCEVLSRNSENESRSCVENPRSHSFWEDNPMYSKGGLKDTKDLVHLGVGTARREERRQESVFSEAKYSEPHRLTREDVIRQNYTKIDNNEGSAEQMTKSAKSEFSVHGEAANVTDDSAEDSGHILNHTNNFGFQENGPHEHQLSYHKSETNIDLTTATDDGGDMRCNTKEHSQTEAVVNEDAEQNSPLKLKCAHILNNLDEMIQTFEQIQHRVFSDSDDNRQSNFSIKDHEFDNMCERAEHIIEETLKCNVDSGTGAVKVQKKNNLGTIQRTSSDMSDEVFLNTNMEHERNFSPVFTNNSSEHKQRHKSADINDIFDDGKNTTPPIPPVRKKKVQETLNTSSDNEKSDIVSTERKVASSNDSTLQNTKHTYENVLMSRKGDSVKSDIVSTERKGALGNESALQKATHTHEKVSMPVKQNNEKSDTVSTERKVASSNDSALQKTKHTYENVLISGKEAINLPKGDKNISRVGSVVIKKENSEEKSNFNSNEKPTKNTVITNFTKEKEVFEAEKLNKNDPRVNLSTGVKITGEKLNLHPSKADAAKDGAEKSSQIQKEKPNIGSETPSHYSEQEKPRTEPKANVAVGKMSTFKIVSNNKGTIETKIDNQPVGHIESSSTKGEKKMVLPVNASDLVDHNDPEEYHSSLDSTESSPFDPKIHLTQTRPISFTTFPPRNLGPGCTSTPLLKKNISLYRDPSKVPSAVTAPEIFCRTNSIIGRPISFHTFSKSSSASNILPDADTNTTLLKYSSTGDGYGGSSHNASRTSSPCGTPRSARALTEDPSRPMSWRTSTDRSLEESLERTRKGSNASDIAAWKLRFQLASSYYHDEEMDPNSMLSNEWFSGENSSLLAEDSSKDGTLSVPGINVTPCKEGQAPPVQPAGATDKPQEDTRIEKLSVANLASLIEAELRGSQHGPYRVKKSKSMVLVSSKLHHDEKGEVPSTQVINWAECWDENTRVIKECAVHRTKISEHGKKVRKNWVASYAVLTDIDLLFFKDAKTFQTMKTSPEKFNPELSMGLSGAVIDIGDKLSSRKNVLSVSDSSGLQVLLQLPGSSATEQWYHHIHMAIALLGPSDNLRFASRECSPSHNDKSSPDDSFIKSPKMSRSKSVKVVNKDLASNEDLSGTAEERHTKNKARLKKFFVRRPTKESLVKKGIYKDEPMFGRNLCDVVIDCIPSVPRFVTQCIRVIESKEENMKADGLYRASGNLSQVQRIRLQADQNHLTALDEEEDVHVLTGALKLFFRELKKPLIPCELFHKAIAASALRDHKERIQQFRQLVQALPVPNHNTLDFLLQHLLKVNQNNEFNRMHIPNIAIVFGPTLMWPEEESVNMALDLMKQNLVIERLLVEYYEIFH